MIDFYVRVDLLASTGFSLPSFFLFSGSKSEQYRETPEESRSLTQLRNLSQVFEHIFFIILCYAPFIVTCEASSHLFRLWCFT